MLFRSLTGAGGIGKSRLSLQAAEAAASTYADGAWLVELAAVAEPTAVGHAVAGALGVASQPGKTIEQSLADALARRHALLVLDNCEHLIESVAALAQMLLTRCAKVTLLATSREALRVQGEQTWPVPALGLDGDAASPAAALFVDRAHQVAAGFVPGEHAQAITEICRRLEGIPLAIELAAARVRCKRLGAAS